MPDIKKYSTLKEDSIRSVEMTAYIVYGHCELCRAPIKGKGLTSSKARQELKRYYRQHYGKEHTNAT